jgi:hypothetical protein
MTLASARRDWTATSRTTPEAYMPRPQFAMFVAHDLPEAGPVTNELRELIEKWRTARRHDEALRDALSKAGTELAQARGALRGLRTAREVSAADGDPLPEDDAELRAAEERIAEAERVVEERADRQGGFIEQVRQREQAADHFLQVHRAEIVQEFLPYFADVDYEFRQTLRKLRQDFDVLHEQMVTLDHIQAAVNGQDRVFLAGTNPGHTPAEELVREAEYSAEMPVVRLPEEFWELAKQLGVVVRDETDYRIPVSPPLRPVRMIDGTDDTSGMPVVGAEIAEERALSTADVASLVANGPTPDRGLPPDVDDGIGPDEPPAGPVLTDPRALLG